MTDVSEVLGNIVISSQREQQKIQNKPPKTGGTVKARKGDRVVVHGRAAIIKRILPDRRLVQVEWQDLSPTNSDLIGSIHLDEIIAFYQQKERSSRSISSLAHHASQKSGKSFKSSMKSVMSPIKETHSHCTGQSLFSTDDDRERGHATGIRDRSRDRPGPAV
jgi:hypothetical protein